MSENSPTIITKPSELAAMGQFNNTRGIVRTNLGREINLSALDPADLVTDAKPYSREQKPLFRLVLEEVPGTKPGSLPTAKIYGKRSVIDPDDPDKKARIDEFLPYLGAEIRFYVLAIKRRRSFMEPYAKTEGKGKPICAAHGFYNPDIRFAGKVTDSAGKVLSLYDNRAIPINDSHGYPVVTCCGFDEKKQKDVTTCPAGRWKHETGSDGKDKRIPPLCSEQYIMYGLIAVPDDDEESGFRSEVVYVVFKRTAEPAGRSTLAKLNAAKELGLPMFCTEVYITWQPAKASVAFNTRIGGRTYTPAFKGIDIDKNPLPNGFDDNREFFTEDQLGDFEAALGVVKTAEEILAARAAWDGKSDDYSAYEDYLDPEEQGFEADIEMGLPPIPPQTTPAGAPADPADITKLNDRQRGGGSKLDNPVEEPDEVEENKPTKPVTTRAPKAKTGQI